MYLRDMNISIIYFLKYILIYKLKCYILYKMHNDKYHINIFIYKNRVNESMQ